MLVRNGPVRFFFFAYFSVGFKVCLLCFLLLFLPYPINGKVHRRFYKYVVQEKYCRMNKSLYFTGQC